MNQVEVISKALESHQIRPDFTQIGPDCAELDSDQAEFDPETCYLPPLVQHCKGCGWNGWDHRRHRAEEVSKALDEARWITTVDELKAIARNPEILAGPLIKGYSFASLGGVYEGNDDGTWGDYDDPKDDRRVEPEDVPLPALLLWEPVSGPHVPQ